MVKHPSMELSRRLSTRLRDLPPVLVAIMLTVAGFLVMATVLVLIGLFITHGPLHDQIGRWDASVTRWFAHHESNTLTSLSAVGSSLGMTQVIIGVEVVAVIVLSIVRRLRDLGYLVAVVALEASVAFTTSGIVDRPRPAGIRLEAVPPTKSFPSGHTAAAIALYVGLAVIITPHVRHRLIRAAIWAIAVILPVYVGISRVYRGMHHATDVFGSLILGVMALTVGWLVVATTAAVWREQQGAAGSPELREPLYPAEVGP